MKNIVDKISDDSSNIVITSKSVKWIMGIIATGVVGILGFAWNLYIAVNNKVDKVKDDIIAKMEQLDKEKVKPSVEKNYMQDVDIGRLYERTNRNSEPSNIPAPAPTPTQPQPPSLNHR